MAKQSLETDVTTFFVGKQVRLAVVCCAAERVIESTVDSNTHEIGGRQVAIGRDFSCFGGTRTKHRGNIDGDVFQNDIGTRDSADVATCAREGYPWTWSVLAVGTQHVGLCVSRSRNRGIAGIEEWRCPVSE